MCGETLNKRFQSCKGLKGVPETTMMIFEAKRLYLLDYK